VKRRSRKHLTIAGYIFAIVGAALLCRFTLVALAERSYQRKHADLFARSFINEMETVRPHAEPSAPVPHEAVARLTIPDLGLSAIVLEGVSARDLRLGPGHIPGTTQPGRPGNIGIAGHRDTVFRPLRLVQKDQILKLETKRGEDLYRVVWTAVVSPRDTRVLRPTNRDSVTLVTCYPFDFIGPAPNRFIVRAERLDSGQ
jgi:LPXTG-site transpeptidase (sortase) family protein